LRAGRRRAEATRTSVVHRLGADTESLVDFLETLEWEAGAPPVEDIAAPRPLALPLADVTALTAAVMTDAIRGGAVLVTVAHHAGLRFGAAVRAVLAPLRANVTFHALDVRAGSGEDVEALSIIAEHGCYTLIGRTSRDDGGSFIKGFHAADPLLADALADHLGRAAGLQIFA
ncbi:MAG: response regulator, partial [Byssovorax sp.]